MKSGEEEEEEEGVGQMFLSPELNCGFPPSSARVCKALGEAAAASGLFVAACMDGGMVWGISLLGLEAFANNKCFAI